MTSKARKVARKQSPSPPSYQAVADESRARIKIRALMLDYEDLAKETEAKRQRLLDAKKNRRDLLAQVRFLRRRYQSLMNDPPQNSLQHASNESHQAGPSTQTLRQFPKPPLPPPAARVRSTTAKPDPILAKKSQRECVNAVPMAPLSFDLNQSAFTAQKQQHHQTTPTIYSRATVDFPVKEKSHRGKDIAAPSMPSFALDLNQVALPTPEEAEYRSTWEAPAWDWPAKNYPITTVEADCAMVDLSLAACRNMGKASGRSGKRKNSWQDQVALRV